jgi:D-3-phosphoglycerate dehydrogenase
MDIGSAVPQNAPALVIHTDRDQPVDPADQKRFEELGAHLVRIDSDAEFLKVARHAVAVLNSGFRLTAPLIQALDQCRVISRYGSGVDNIDVAAATGKGIPVANVPVFCVEEVANRCLTLLLACSCRLVSVDTATRQGVWGVQNIPSAEQIEGQTLGLVGFGKIARAVANRAKPFGWRIIAHDPFVSPEAAAEDEVELCDLDALLQKADYVSLHVPLTSSTRHLLSASRLALMKPSSFLVNTARGGLIDEAALIEVLRHRRIAGAGLDVFETEPPVKDHPMFGMDNVILTPHCSSHTRLATAKVRSAAVDAVMRVLQGERPVHVVNPELFAN